MASLKKIKFMQKDSDVPSTTPEDEIYAVPFNASMQNAPDFNAKIGLGFGTNYTVGSGALAKYSQGYVMAGCRSRSDDSSPDGWFNGHRACLMGYDHDYGGDLSGYCIFVALNKGDSFSIGGSAGSPIMWFIPTKQ